MEVQAKEQQKVQSYIAIAMVKWLNEYSQEVQELHMQEGDFSLILGPIGLLAITTNMETRILYPSINNGIRCCVLEHYCIKKNLGQKKIVMG